ncbi:MAG: hypothetical protein U5N26_09260 [Candidatus Marinimicrobia bacterium]|nr:hypothetical protein [Candidatus Neomarinimicrobiota bacterium]
MVGFLWFNSRPAEVFMGDTGSLAYGAALGTIAILLKKEIVFLLIGMVFVIEAASVVIQIGWFRHTKKRFGEGRRCSAWRRSIIILKNSAGRKARWWSASGSWGSFVH